MSCDSRKVVFIAWLTSGVEREPCGACAQGELGDADLFAVGLDFVHEFGDDFDLATVVKELSTPLPGPLLDRGREGVFNEHAFVVFVFFCCFDFNGRCLSVFVISSRMAKAECAKLQVSLPADCSLGKSYFRQVSASVPMLYSVQSIVLSEVSASSRSFANVYRAPDAICDRDETNYEPTVEARLHLSPRGGGLGLA